MHKFPILRLTWCGEACRCVWSEGERTYGRGIIRSVVAEYRKNYIRLALEPHCVLPDYGGRLAKPELISEYSAVQNAYHVTRSPLLPDEQDRQSARIARLQ